MKKQQEEEEERKKNEAIEEGKILVPEGASLGEALRILKAAKIKNEALKQSDVDITGKKKRRKTKITDSDIRKSKTNLSEKEYDAKIKNAFMWNLGRSQDKQAQDLSKGIGLAMLSRVLGVKKIEDNL